MINMERRMTKRNGLFRFVACMFALVVILIGCSDGDTTSDLSENCVPMEVYLELQNAYDLLKEREGMPIYRYDNLRQRYEELENLIDNSISQEAYDALREELDYILENTISQEVYDRLNEEISQLEYELAQFVAEEVAEPEVVGAHPIVGNWDRGTGRIFLFVFGTPQAVEFRENGRVTIIDEDGFDRTVNWSSSDEGQLRVDGRDFSYSIHNNQLRITDEWGDDWTFTRVD